LNQLQQIVSKPKPSPFGQIRTPIAQKKPSALNQLLEKMKCEEKV
jgi:hypothetical protein